MILKAPTIIWWNEIDSFLKQRKEWAWNLVAAFILKGKELDDEDKRLEELELPELEMELKKAQRDHLSNFRKSIRGNHNFDKYGESAMSKSYNKIMKIKEIIKKKS